MPVFDHPIPEGALGDPDLGAECVNGTGTADSPPEAVRELPHPQLLLRRSRGLGDGPLLARRQGAGGRLHGHQLRVGRARSGKAARGLGRWRGSVRARLHGWRYDRGRAAGGDRR